MPSERRSSSEEHAYILGPNPGDGMFSIFNYFNFCKQHLRPLLASYQIDFASPGDASGYELEVYRSVGRLHSYWSNYAVWPLTLRSLRADLFHTIDQGLAWYNRFLRGGRKVVTVHDLIMYLNWTGKLNFEPVTRARAEVLKQCLPQIQKADHIMAISRHTADCLVRELNIPASRITLTPNWADTSFQPLDDIERARARQRWFGSAGYAVLHVGRPSGYKNRIGAIRAFALVHKQVPDASMFLAPEPPTPEEEQFIREAGCPVRSLGAIPRADLRTVYASADVFVFPSRYEGFGWPPLEAMACGCPVVSTTCASLAEVVGDAALTVDDPEDHAGLARHILTVLKDPHTAADLRRRGLDHVRSFHPSLTAARIADVYRSQLK